MGFHSLRTTPQPPNVNLPSSGQQVTAQLSACKVSVARGGARPPGQGHYTIYKKILSSNLKQRDHQEDLDVNGRAVLKCTLQKLEGIVWTGLIGLGARSQWCNVAKEVIHLQGVGVSWQAKRLLASEGLCCIQSAVNIVSRKEQTADGRWQFSANISRFRPRA